MEKSELAIKRCTESDADEKWTSKKAAAVADAIIDQCMLADHKERMITMMGLMAAAGSCLAAVDSSEVKKQLIGIFNEAFLTEVDEDDG